jgi:hypothetical protein
MRKLSSVGAIAIGVTLLLGGTTAQAQAGSAAAAQSAPAAASLASGSTGTYYLLFNKNQSNPTQSKLYLMKDVPGTDKKIESWQAGSGNGSKDECASMRGWLPNGPYRILGHETRKNGGRSGINGYAIHLQNKVCKPKPKPKPGKRKTLRTELFIHSEMKPNGKQGPKLYDKNHKRKDSPYRWDGPSDYYSLGCIKLKHTDIQDLFRKANHYGWPKQLRVVN